ncbi:MAG: glutamate-5-semialdehyde dehydrogenase [Azospirillum brasilense]|nr:MAG: glutamate-5-semialdehyde dehydrogenase [Azospirillum brasilense]
MSDVLTPMLEALAQRAREATRVLANVDAASKAAGLRAAAASLRSATAEILRANQQDLAHASGLTDALKDRLTLTDARIEAMATGVETVAGLCDPVGRVLDAWTVPHNGIRIEKIAVPIGVVGMIYESRPNVTADAAAIAIYAGNAVLLRGGSESVRSNTAIADAMRSGLQQAGLPVDSMQLIPTQDRAAVGWMLQSPHALDVIIPRGGKTLTERVAREARVATLLHLEGNCHLYVHAAADVATAQRVVMNAKLRRTGICGAMESLLLDAAIAPTLGRTLVQQLLDAGCELRGDATVQGFDARVKPATDEDWATEYLAPICSVKIVPGVEAAIAHINQHGSHHTDGIITTDQQAAAQFTQAVDSAIVTVNASTQFADGGEFGFGAEIGIATGRLHARGPVGAAQLVTYKYIVRTDAADGAIRAG